MKHTFKYFCLLLLVTGFASCEADDETVIETVDVEGYAYLMNRSLSVLDQNEEITIKLYTDNGVTFESLTVVDAEGNTIATPTMVNDSIATFNSSDFGGFDETFSVRINSTLSNGMVLSDYANITVYDAIELDAENPSSVSIDSLANTSLTYTVSTFNATVDDVDFAIKKNSSGTYTSQELDLPVTGGTVDLERTNYEALNLSVNDTLYYQFTATSGSESQDAEGYIAIME